MEKSVLMGDGDCYFQMPDGLSSEREFGSCPYSCGS